MQNATKPNTTFFKTSHNYTTLYTNLHNPIKLDKMNNSTKPCRTLQNSTKLNKLFKTIQNSTQLLRNSTAFVFQNFTHSYKTFTQLHKFIHKFTKLYNTLQNYTQLVKLYKTSHNYSRLYKTLQHSTPLYKTL